jgi:uncharacterized protein involved in outer membrane biogenesis
MRKPVIIVGVIVGAIILIVGAVFIYAAANLNSVIAKNRELILARASAALGRQVQVAQIKAQLGWGVTADLSDVKIADDSDFSSQPFVSASDIYAKLDLMPLLAKQIRISKVVLQQPQIRIVRNTDGQLNVSTIGKKNQSESAPSGSAEKKAEGGIEQSPMSEAPEKSAKGEGNVLKGLEVHSFAIDDGKLVYENTGQPPLTISHIDLEVTAFSFTSPFDLSLKMAALGEDQNIKLSGKVGPLVAGSRIDPNQIPVDLGLTAGPFVLDQVRKLEFAKAIPNQLKVTDKVSLDATIKGKLDSLSIHGSTNLTPNQIAFGDSFQKPSGTKLRLDVDAVRDGSSFGVSQAQVALADLSLKATKIKFGGGNFSGRIDTNRFDIASVAALSPAASKLGIAGNAEIHTDIARTGGQPTANGVVTLAGVTIPRSGHGGGTAISNLNGDIKLAGSAADVGPLAFKLGKGSATLKAHANPIYPPQASYQFTADALHTADFSPNRPPNEQLNQVRADGTFSMTSGAVTDDNRLTSPSGNLNNISYTGLTVVSALAGKNLKVSKLEIGAFGGRISGNANAVLDKGGPFNAAVTMASLDLQQALESQKAKAAGVVRGLLSGQVQLSGKNNGDFDAIKPTLAGRGQVSIAQGKLVGVNIGAEVFRKTQNLPVIGSLVPQSIANRHPELFQSPDTDFQQMGLSFVIQGPRITSHDIEMKTVDYALNGDGWFDMDKNIDLSARILLSQQLTREIIEQKKNVVYVTNNSGQIDIPLRITGQLPKPNVLPDVTELAQRAGQRAVEQKGQKALQKALGNKGLGKFLGGSGDEGSGGGSNQPSNPLNQLKGLFGH